MICWFRTEQSRAASFAKVVRRTTVPYTKIPDVARLLRLPQYMASAWLKRKRTRTSYPHARGALPAASPPSPISKYSKGDASLMSVSGGMCLDQCRHSSIVLLEPLLGSRALESNGRTQFSNALLTLSVKSGVDSRPRTSLRGTYHP